MDKAASRIRLRFLCVFYHVKFHSGLLCIAKGLPLEGKEALNGRQK